MTNSDWTEVSRGQWVTHDLLDKVKTAMAEGMTAAIFASHPPPLTEFQLLDLLRYELRTNPLEDGSFISPTFIFETLAKHGYVIIRDPRRKGAENASP